MQRFWDSTMALTPNDDDDDIQRLYAFKLFGEIFPIF